MSERDMTKRNRKVLVHDIVGSTAIGPLLPSRAGQTDIGPMRPRANNAQTSRVPTKGEQYALHRSRPFDKTGTVSTLFSGPVPGTFMTVIVTHRARHFLIES